jgi:hypothetical protein
MSSLIACGAATLILGVGTAGAQPTVSPSGEPPPTPEAPPAQPAPAATPPPVIVNVGGKDAKGGKGGKGAKKDVDLGNYHLDDYKRANQGRTSQWDIKVHGPPPELHTVRSGDTLWDISWFYFNNPWEWPKVWSYNPAITNPHWIYPGDRVRLYPSGVKPTVSKKGPEPGTITPSSPRTPARYGVTLRRTTFVDQKKLKFAAKIVGSVDAKTMLSRGDSVYLEYPSKKPPKVGKRYAIYTVKKAVRDPKTKKGKGKVIGSYVRIVGELEVVSVKKGKRARAIIQNSTDVVQRGQLVGPLKRRFRDITPVANERNLQGTIVAMLDRDELIGPGQAVFIDLGKKSKLKVGNRLYVVRRGDAYQKVMSPGNNRGQDDRRFPARAIAEVIVVQVGDVVSLAVVRASVKEAGVGDLVLMRKSR